MKTLVTIKVVEADDGTRDVTIDAPSDLPAAEPLDLAIQRLARLRSATLPAFAELPNQVGAEMEVVEDPRVWAHVAFDGSPVLTFRHPGFGFVSFSLTPESIDYLQRHLTHVQQPSGDRTQIQ